MFCAPLEHVNPTVGRASADAECISTEREPIANYS
jgi:hypothetical protein